MFDPKHIKTLGVSVHPISINTNYGQIGINLWDMAGNPKYIGLGNGYTVAAEACIIFIDGSVDHPTDVPAYNNWYDAFSRTNTAPVIAIRTKCDMLPKVKFLDCVQAMSSKTGENIMAPIVEVLRQLSGKHDLEYVEKKNNTK
jgi:GTPase SAR1 family protein